MALTLVRRAASVLVALHCVVAAGLVAAAADGDNTWIATGAFVERLSSPVFALAVDPADGHRLMAGTASGSIHLSVDGGASWRQVRKGAGRAVQALAFDPAHPATVLAGTDGAGILRSDDGGQGWQAQQGSNARSVRAFAFANGAALAASDEGVLSSRDGAAWSSAGLKQVRVSALTAVPPSSGAPNGTLVAGGDGTRGGEPLPLFSSTDGGQSWTAVSVTGPSGVIGGSSVVAALTGGAVQRQNVRPLLVGTNAGLFMTRDRGANWQQLTGGGALPATDVSGLATAPRRADRLYVASDGGGSSHGGLWVSTDLGSHFAWLAPPVPEVTALAVTGDDPPTLVVATFRPTDHAVVVWTYRDAGGKPQGPAALPPSPGAGPSARNATPAGTGRPGLIGLVARPETPFLVLGVAALAVIVLAAVAYVRRGRQR